MKTFITAASAITPRTLIDDAVLVVEDGRIVECGSRTSLSVDGAAQEFPGATLAPGYIDLHTHGAAGHDVMNCTTGELQAVGSFLAKHGVIAYLPTTITAPLDKMLKSLELLAKAVETFDPSTSRDCARPLGIHLEGPFISYARRGVHPAVHILQPTVELFERFWQAANGHVSLLTIAPEMPEALAVIAAARRRGITVALGHTNATLDKAREAIEAGATHATHAFNAMRRLEHRDPGVLGAVLADRSITADVIVDGLHVLPPVVDIFLRTKGVDRAVLISDSTSATGMPDGVYHLGAFEVNVTGLRCESHGKLAGSVLTLDVAIRNVMEFAGWSLQDAVRLASLNPARVLRQDSTRGELRTGADADFNVLSPKGEVLKTFIAGQPVQ